MALGIKIESEGSDVNGGIYRIRVYENDYAGSPINLALGPDIFKLDYEPVDDDIAAPLCPSNAEVYFYNQNNANDFLSELLENQQLDYYLTIEYKATSDDDYSPYWKGSILQDQTRQIEQSYPSLFSITAIDGIGFLENVEYNPDAADGSGPNRSLKDIIIEALQNGLPSELWAADEDYLWTTVNWWEEDQTYGAFDDPLKTLFLNEYTFQTQTEKYDIYVNENSSSFEVLNEIAKTFVSRIYMAGGKYVFEQISERKDQLVKRFNYFKDGTDDGTEARISQMQTLDESRGQARWRDNVVNHYPAIKQVILEQRSYNENLNRALSLDASSLGNSNSRDFGIYNQFPPDAAPLPIGQNFEFTIDFKNHADIIFDSSSYQEPIGTTNQTAVYARRYVEVTIKLEDVNSSDEYYFDGAQWRLNVNVPTTVYSHHTRNASTVITSGNTRRVTITNSGGYIVTTANLPVTGRLTVTLDQLNFQVATDSYPFRWLTVSNPAVYENLSGNITLGFTTKYDNGDTTRFVSLINANANINDNEIVDLGTIIFSDGGLQEGSIMVDTTGTGNSLMAATNWGYANNADDLALANMIARERLAIQDDVFEIYEGTIQMPKPYNWGIQFNSKRYIPHTYSLNAFRAEVNGTWHLINRSDSIPTDLPDPQVGLGQIPSVNYDFFRVQTIQEIGGVFIGLGRMGPIFLEDDETDSRLPIRSSSGVRTSVKSVEVSDSADIDLTETDHVIYLSWSGAAGSGVVNFPEIDDGNDGIEMVFILDPDLTAEQDIVLTAAETQTVQGQSSLTVDGNSNSRLVFYANSDNWIGG